MAIRGKVSSDGNKMVAKQPEVTEATRKRLIEAFCKFYKDKTIEKISVREIVEEAGYSRATFYNYFSDPYALLDYVEESLIHDVITQIQTEGYSLQDSGHFVRAFTKVVESNMSYLDIFSNPQSNYLMAEKLKELAMPMIIQSLGLSADDVGQRLALEFYISGLVSTLNSWLSHQDEISIDLIAETLHRALWKGLLSQQDN